jgi:hypothetical protein
MTFPTEAERQRARAACIAVVEQTGNWVPVMLADDIFDRLYPPVVDAPDIEQPSVDEIAEGTRYITANPVAHRVCNWMVAMVRQDCWRDTAGQAHPKPATPSPAFAAAVRVLDELVALIGKKWLSPPFQKTQDGLSYSVHEWGDDEVSLDYAIGEVRRIAARAALVRVHLEEVERGK